MVTKLFSFDVQTNGPWGQGFAVAAVIYENGWESPSYFLGRCPIVGDVNGWVEKNVLPQIAGIKKTHDSYKDMLRSFAEFYLENKEGADIIVHIGLPAEVKLMLDMYVFGFIIDCDAPYPLIDIAGNLQQAGFKPTSLHGYNSFHGNVVPSCEGGECNPLYNARAAALCYISLMKD